MGNIGNLTTLLIGRPWDSFPNILNCNICPTSIHFFNWPHSGLTHILENWSEIAMYCVRYGDFFVSITYFEFQKFFRFLQFSEIKSALNIFVILKVNKWTMVCKLSTQVLWVLRRHSHFPLSSRYAHSSFFALVIGLQLAYAFQAVFPAFMSSLYTRPAWTWIVISHHCNCFGYEFFWLKFQLIMLKH